MAESPCIGQASVWQCMYIAFVFKLVSLLFGVHDLTLLFGDLTGQSYV